MKFLHALLLALTLVACGGDDDTGDSAVDAAVDARIDAAADASVDADVLTLDVDPSTFLDQMTEDELAALCEWMVQVQGGPHTVDCGDGVMVTIDPADECIATPEWPHCEVRLISACVEAQAVDLCGDAPTECDAFYACAFGL